MGRTAATGGSGMANMWRSVEDDGEALKVDPDGLYKLVEPDSSDFCTPPAGTRARLRISGLSEAFERPSYNDPEVLEDKVNVEFQILNISGKNIEWMKTKRFSQMFTGSEKRIGPKSALGQLFAKLTGEPVPSNMRGYPYDGYIDTEFVSLIGENKAGTYARIDPAGIETAKTVLSPAVRAYFAGTAAPTAEREPELAGVGAAAGGADDDPFLTDDL